MTEVLITSSVLILVLFLMRKVFRNSLSRRLQYALWALVLIRLLIPMNLPAMDFSVLTAAKPVEETVTQSIAAQPLYVPVAQAPLEEHPAAAVDTAPEQADTFVGESVWVAQTEQETAVKYKRLSVQTVLSWVWMAGSFTAAAFLLFVNVRFWLWLRRVRKPFDVEDCKLPVYLVEAGLPSPCLFGLFRPAIYLTPAAVEAENRLHHVLAHEMTHAQHFDHLWTFLRGVCLAVYWFDPLVWVAASAAKKDCELACDEGALAKLEEDDRIPYGKTLLSLIPVRQTVNPMLAATAMTSGKRHLKDRVTRIAKKSRQTVAAVLAVVLLTVAVSACTFTGGKNDRPLELCVDTTDYGFYGSEYFRSALENWIYGLKTEGIETEIAVRFIPADGNERDIELRKIKTEIMSGKGPDLFLVLHNVAIETMLFPSPEKSMQNKLFLPLDSYLENAKYMEVEDFPPAVWEAGSLDGTQYILPLTYTFPATVFHAEDVSLDASMTYGEMVENSDLNFAASVSWVRPGSTLGNHFIDTFAKILDAEDDSVSLSESELQEHMRQILEVAGKERDGKLSGADPHFQVNMSPDFNTFDHAAASGNFFQNITPEDDVSFVPVFNSAGGVTASVVSYVAINGATERPEEAFEIVDFLLSKRTQTGQMFRMMTEDTALPIDSSLLVPGSESARWEMTEQSYNEFLKVQGMISHVRLPSYLNYLLTEMYWDCYSCYFGYEEGDINEIVADVYRSLQMFAGES